MFFSFLGSAWLWDWDEAINASTAREMYVRNDWIVPRFNDDLNFNKPIMVTLGIILSYSIFGITEFAARFPSAIWSIGTIICIYHIGLRFFGRAVAFRAAIVLATSLMFCVEARAATPDAVLIFWITAAIMIFATGTYLPPVEDENIANPPRLRYENEYFPKSTAVVALMYAAMGVAVLAKGPIGFLIPTSVIGLFLLIKRLEPTPSENLPLKFSLFQFIFNSILRVFHPVHFFKTCVYMRLGIGLLAVLVVAAPWYIWVGLKTDWEWPMVFLLKHNVSRALAPMEGHKGPFYFYFFALLFGTFPWSVFFLPTCIDIVKRLNRGTPFADGLIFSLCWSGIIITAFSFVATKLPNYIASMFPAAALIYAVYLHFWTQNKDLAGKFWTPVVIGVYGLVGLIMTLVLGLLPHFFPKLLPGEGILAIIGVVVLIGAVIAAIVWVRTTEPNFGQGSKKTLDKTLRLSFITFIVVIFFWAPARISKHQEYVKTFAELRRHSPNAKIALVGCLEPSWIFYFGEPMPRLDFEGANEFLKTNPEDGYIMLNESDLETLDSQLEKPLTPVQTVPYFLRQKNLVIAR